MGGLSIVNQNEKIKINEFINVKDKIRELGLDVSSNLIILPSNFENVKFISDLDYSSTDTLVIKKMFRLDGLDSELLVNTRDITKFSEAEILTITLLITQEFLLPIVLGIISNRLDSYLKNKEFKLRLTFEANEDSKLVTFDGTVPDLIEAEDTIIKISSEISGIEPLVAIEKAKKLLDDGAITNEHFEIIRNKYMKILET